MKKIFVILFVVIHWKATAQNVGIGTNQPVARLHVQDSSVLFTGSSGVHPGPFVTPVSGAGTRFMWYANLGALRAGNAVENEWNGDSIGRYSVAMGQGGLALGAGSVSLGWNTSARGSSTVALGNRAAANGTWSAAIGDHPSANGIQSIAVGTYTIANGTASTAMGYKTSANGDHATSLGAYTNAGGENATAIGYTTEASSFASTALGYGTIARGYACTAVGYYNTSITIDTQTAITSTSPLFIVGNGTDTYHRTNAFVVLKNGNVGIGNNNPQANLVVNDNETDPIIQLQQFGDDIGFVQVSGNNLRLGTNASNTTGNVVIRVNGGDRFTVFGNGNATLTGTLTQNSDARFKSNIRPLTHALSTVMKLNGYRYYWKEGLKKDPREQVGLIAQNVESVLPQLVATDADGNKSVAYQNMVPVLIEAIKEQQQLISRLQTQVEQLQQKNNQTAQQ